MYASLYCVINKCCIPGCKLNYKSIKKITIYINYSFKMMHYNDNSNNNDSNSNNNNDNSRNNDNCDIVRYIVIVYSAGSGVNRVQVVLSRFSMRLFCFVQANTLCRYGCMYFLASLVLVCVDVMVMASA